LGEKYLFVGANQFPLQPPPSNRGLASRSPKPTNQEIVLRIFRGKDVLANQFLEALSEAPIHLNGRLLELGAITTPMRKAGR